MEGRKLREGEMETKEPLPMNTDDGSRVVNVALPKVLVFSFVVVVSDGSKTTSQHSTIGIEVRDEYPHLQNLTTAINDSIDEALKALPNSHIVSFSHARLN